MDFVVVVVVDFVVVNFVVVVNILLFIICSG